KLKSQQLGVITFVLSGGYLVGAFLATFLSQRLEKRTVAMIGISLIGVGQLCPVGLALLGVIPISAAVPVLMIASVVSGIGAAAALIGFQSAMADAADEHEHLFGARREGLYFAGISFSAKASSGIGAIIAGIIIDLIDFPKGLDLPGAPHVAVPDAVIHRLAAFHGPGAAVITGIAVLILSLYRRGRRDHEEVRTALLERRATAGN
ncbi:MAG TPA: MFS transporter, partial [Caulobacteraceae bacterium]|nr:MFS transporter [Caulobacteraceae bacterium]